MRIDVWADITCPFCAIGRAELDRALEAFPHADAVAVVPRAFELHPGAAAEPLASYLRAKYGWSPAQIAAQCDQIAARAAALGMRYDWRRAVSAPTLDAHRLVKWAGASGLADAVERALVTAHLTEGLDISDHGVLAAAAVGAGADAEGVREVLATDAYADDVRRDTAEGQRRGVRGTPFFLVDDRYAVSGAQPRDAFLRVLERAWEDRRTPPDAPRG